MLPNLAQSIQIFKLSPVNYCLSINIFLHIKKQEDMLLYTVPTLCKPEVPKYNFSKLYNS